MAKGEFAQFVKQHYDKVRDKPARERLKVLGEMYRAGSGKAKPAKKAVKGAGFISDLFGGAVPQQKGGGLFTDALGDLGPIGSFVPHLLGLGGGLEGGAMAGKKPRRAVQQMPLSLVPPSVPVDRATTKNTGVPGPLRSGVATSNPHEQEIELKRASQPNPMVQRQGTFVRQGASRQPTPQSTDLKTMMGMFGMTLPPRMRNVPAGGALSKSHLKRIYQHTMATHGEKGGGVFDDIARGFSQGFRLPFKAIGALI